MPQFGLPVYAFARRGGRYVAAGRAALDLDAGRFATVPIHLVGESHERRRVDLAR